MTNGQQWSTVGRTLEVSRDRSLVPAVLTRLVWGLWLASLLALGATVRFGWSWSVPGLFAVDGLTVLMWTVVTFFSGIVHSYSRRYMAGNRDITRFFLRLFAFTLVVGGLVAADHLALFLIGWLAMGLMMAGLVGHVKGWPQAQAAARLARRYFLASSGLLAVGLAVLWASTGATTISGVVAAVETVPETTALVAAGSILLAAMIQSSLVPFHGWLLSSMTAPTPASALMHAGFVNAGGILLTRFAPLFATDPAVMGAVAVAGGASALLGKVMKSVQTDVKRKLGCSTVGQMGFMILQAGLGFFAAAVTHLILHGFYKAYQFLSAGGQVEHAAPRASSGGSTGAVGSAVALLSAVAGGLVFAVLTGKGTHLDSGLVLVLFVVLTTQHATREVVGRADLPRAVRFVGFPAVFLAAIGTYATVYTAVSALLADVPMATAPVELTTLHAILVGAFVAGYIAIEWGLHRHSKRLYVALMNASQPAPATVLTATEEYNEF